MEELKKHAVKNNCARKVLPQRENGLRQGAVAGEDKLLTRAEAADLLGVAPATLANWAWRGCGPPVTLVGRLPRYRLSAVEAWLRSRTRTFEEGGER